MNNNIILKRFMNIFLFEYNYIMLIVSPKSCLSFVNILTVLFLNCFCKFVIKFLCLFSGTYFK